MSYVPIVVKLLYLYRFRFIQNTYLSIHVIFKTKEYLELKSEYQ